MRGFVARQQEFVARLDADERAVLAGIASEVAVLLGATPFRTAEGLRRTSSRRSEGHVVGPVDEGAAAHDRSDEPGALDDDVTDVPLSALGFAWQRPVAAPRDPAVRRILPDASEDPELAAEFRRLTDADLRERKIAGLRTWWHALRTPGGRQGDAVAITAAEAPAVAAAMTDVRLVLADRLGVRTDEDGEAIYRELERASTPGESDAASGATAGGEAAAVRRAFIGVYAMLSELQETLVGEMLAQARARGGAPYGRPGRRGTSQGGGAGWPGTSG